MDIALTSGHAQCEKWVVGNKHKILDIARFSTVKGQRFDFILTHLGFVVIVWGYQAANLVALIILSKLY